MPDSLRIVLKRHLLKAEERVGNEFLSRWTFERQLDLIASSVRDYLDSAISKDKNGKSFEGGCSIFYRLPDGSATRCRLGGGSEDRRKMSSSSRSYDLAAPQSGFTAFSIVSNTTLLLEPFEDACEAFEAVGIVHHQPKDCDNPAQQTNSFYCRPLCGEAGKEARRPNDIPQAVRAHPAGDPLPIGALRISSPRKDVVEDIHRLIDAELIGRIHRVVLKGAQQVAANRERDADALTIADFNADLLRYRHSEYYGLDRLAYHLQTIFDECEVSIFVADLPPLDRYEPWVALRLAATTALGRAAQHTKFRRAFNVEAEHYTCQFRGYEDYGPLEAAMHDCAKTELAYYRPNEPIYQEENTISSKFAGRGEFDRSGSFLAMAIPGETPQLPPYGVIRVVSAEKGYFGERQRRLFAAICRGLASWAQLFPRKFDKAVGWRDERHWTAAADHLKGATSHDLIRAEIRQLLYCLFCREDSAEILDIDTSSKNSLVLRAEVGSGAVVQVFCWRKNLSRFPQFSSPGIRETRHLWGKVVPWPRFDIGADAAAFTPDIVIPGDLEQTGLQMVSAFADAANAILPDSDVYLKMKPASDGWGVRLEDGRNEPGGLDRWFGAYVAYLTDNPAAAGLIEAALEASGSPTDATRVREAFGKAASRLQGSRKDELQRVTALAGQGAAPVVTINIGSVVHGQTDVQAIERIVALLQSTRAEVQQEEQQSQLDELAKTIEEIRKEVSERSGVPAPLLQRAHRQLEQCAHVVNDVVSVFSAANKGVAEFRLLKEVILSVLPFP